MSIPQSPLKATDTSSAGNFWREWILVFAVLWTIWFALGSPRLWDRDEPRNARCAVEMIERGDWVVPMFNDELRTHKPILLYWMQIASYAVFGVTEFAARFGSALCGTLVCIGLYFFGSRQISPSYGRWATLAIASCFMFIVASRAATPDAALIATSSMGILAIVSGQLSQPSNRHRVILTIAGYVCLGLAVLAKGPVGIVIPFAVLGCWKFLQLCSTSTHELDGLRIEHAVWWKTAYRLIQNPYGWWLWLKSSARQTLRIGWRALQELWMLPGLALVVLISAPWYALVGLRTDGQWLYGFFIEHNVQRAVSSMEGHSGGPAYYPIAILFGTFPWSLLLLPILFWISNNLRNRTISPIVQLAVLWITITVGVFTFAGTKLPSYITTCYPGVSLLIAGFLDDWYARRLQLGYRMSLLASSVMGLFGVSLAIGIVIAAIYFAMPQLALCALAPLVLLWPAYSLIRSTSSEPGQSSDQRQVVLRFAFASVVLVGTLLGVGPSLVSRYRTDLDQLIAATASDLPAEHDSTWKAVGTLEPSWIYYLERPIQEVVRVDQDTAEHKNWLTVSLESLLETKTRLILSESDAQKVEQQWRSEFSDRAQGLSLVRMLTFDRFLEDEPMVVLRSVPAEGNRRIATIPHASGPDETGASANR